MKWWAVEGKENRDAKERARNFSSAAMGMRKLIAQEQNSNYIRKTSPFSVRNATRSNPPRLSR
jgi:hypothetical protein